MFRVTHRPPSGDQKLQLQHVVLHTFLPLRWLSHRSGNRQPKTYVKPEAAITVF
jgi:hypothetical protein